MGVSDSLLLFAHNQIDRVESSFRYLVPVRSSAPPRGHENDGEDKFGELRMVPALLLEVHGAFHCAGQ